MQQAGYIEKVPALPEENFFYLLVRVEVWISTCLCGFFSHDASKSAPNPERDMGPTQRRDHRLLFDAR